MYFGVVLVKAVSGGQMNQVEAVCSISFESACSSYTSGIEFALFTMPICYELYKFLCRMHLQLSSRYMAKSRLNSRLFGDFQYAFKSRCIEVVHALLTIYGMDANTSVALDQINEGSLSHILF